MAFSEMPDGLVAQYNVSRESRQMLNTYVNLLLLWQEKINLIGPSTVDQVWQRHIGDALQLLPLLPQSETRIADLGSGAGFPGLVLAMIGAEHVYLYESVGKKVAFMREVIRQTGISAEVHQLRLEDLPKLAKPPRINIVTARALAGLSPLLRYAAPLLTNGVRGLFHKGQDVDTELQEAAKAWTMKTLKHQSKTDSQAVILEVWDVHHV